VKIQLLDFAEADLLAGHGFYERQAPGVGMYFLDTLHSDIDSLRLYAGSHRRVYGYHRLLSRRFPYAFIIKSRENGSRYGVCSIAGAILGGPRNSCDENPGPDEYAEA
jgi:hypothetical protein